MSDPSATAEAPNTQAASKTSGGSRESSEFEFVEGKNANSGGATSALPPPPAPLPAAVGQPKTETISPPKDISSLGPPSSIGPPAQIPVQQTEATAVTSTSPLKDEPKAERAKDTQPSTGAGDSAQGNESDGIFGGLLTKLAQKTKSSVETVITTLDPQMKEFIHSGGDITVVVASDKASKVSPVREAFQTAFGKATVHGVAAPASKALAEQPVGFAAGRQGAAERARALRARPDVVKTDVVVAVEGFLLETGEDEWSELCCLTLSDAVNGIDLTCYSQPTPVDADLVERAKAATPDDYPRRWSGLARTVGSVAAEAWSVQPDQWHLASAGVQRSEIVLLGAKVLAGRYKRELANKVEKV